MRIAIVTGGHNPGRGYVDNHWAILSLIVGLCVTAIAHAPLDLLLGVLTRKQVTSIRSLLNAKRSMSGREVSPKSSGEAELRRTKGFDGIMAR